MKEGYVDQTIFNRVVNLEVNIGEMACIEYALRHCPTDGLSDDERAGLAKTQLLLQKHLLDLGMERA